MTEFLELFQKRICNSILISYRNKTLIVLLRYLTLKRCFWSWSFTSKVRDGLVTVLVLKYWVFHDILHIQTLASYVLFISASLYYVSVHYMTCIWPKSNILDKNYQVFGHIDNTHSSYVYGLTPLTTYQNTWQIHTFPFCISCSCLLTHTLLHICEEHTKTAISKY